MKRVLMIAFHFPPLAGSSGVQRTLRFARHLPRLGWTPQVLTAHPLAYANTRDDLMAEVPPELVVRRALAFDCARHFSLLGRYPAALARPDRWASWRLDGLAVARDMVRRFQPDVIWSTYPIPTAHVIGARVAAETGLPWVADFRDPMVQEGFPADRKTRAMWQAIEAEALGRAACSVFVAPGAAACYRARYPAARVAVVENGFDEDSFQPAPATRPLNPGRLTLVHSGLIYPSERDPTALLEALAATRETLPPLEIRLRAWGDGGWLPARIAALGLQDIVRCLPAIPYREALEEMQRAEGLLLMQAANCNAQIPAKFYEYLRAGVPILALTDARGDTAALMRRSHAEGACFMADIAQANSIAHTLPAFLAALASGRAPRPEYAAVAGAERSARTAELAGILDAVTREHKGETR